MSAPLLGHWYEIIIMPFVSCRDGSLRRAGGQRLSTRLTRRRVGRGKSRGETP